MHDARRTLDSLRTAGLIEWAPPVHSDDPDAAPAHWEPTDAGRQELAQT